MHGRGFFFFFLFNSKAAVAAQHPLCVLVASAGWRIVPQSNFPKGGKKKKKSTHTHTHELLSVRDLGRAGTRRRSSNKLLGLVGVGIGDGDINNKKFCLTTTPSPNCYMCISRKRDEWATWVCV